MPQQDPFGAIQGVQGAGGGANPLAALLGGLQGAGQMGQLGQLGAQGLQGVQGGANPFGQADGFKASPEMQEEMQEQQLKMMRIMQLLQEIQQLEAQKQQQLQNNDEQGAQQTDIKIQTDKAELAKLMGVGDQQQQQGAGAPADVVNPGGGAAPAGGGGGVPEAGGGGGAPEAGGGGAAPAGGGGAAPAGGGGGEAPAVAGNPDDMQAAAANPNAEIPDFGKGANKQQIGQMLDAAAEKYGIPADILKGVAWQESNWNPNARSFDGGHGKGVMQIDDRFHQFARTGDVFDPKKNIEYGAGYLKKLHEQTGSWSGALKRYNGGSDYPPKVMAHAANKPWAK